jgi:hypothetical protein
MKQKYLPEKSFFIRSVVEDMGKIMFDAVDEYY